MAHEAEQLVLELIFPEQRESALLELSEICQAYPNLAPILWHSCGSIASLIYEVVSIYPLLSPPTLTAATSNRACNVLALFECVASHPDTRAHFVNAHIYEYLRPLLNTLSNTHPIEKVRLSSLSVIDAVLKVFDTKVVDFLLSAEIIPACLNTMEFGSDRSKIVATSIVQKIVLDDVGLSYVCATPERFFTVCAWLENMVQMMVETPSLRHLKHIICCFLFMCDHRQACEALKTYLPNQLRDGTFSHCLEEDVTTQRWLTQLLTIVGDGVPMLADQRNGGFRDGPVSSMEHRVHGLLIH